MTITSSVLINTYVGNGSATTFAYQFRIFTDNEIRVTVDGELQSLTTDYTVTGVGELNGGNIVFLEVPATGVQIVIENAPNFTQQIDYNELDAFPAESHEEGLDRAAIRDLALLESVNRSLRFAAGSAVTNTIVGEPVEGATLIFQGGRIVAGPSAGAVGSANSSAIAAAASAEAASMDAASAAASASGLPLNNFSAIVAPSPTDDVNLGYSAGSRWVDTVSDQSYICVDATIGAAIWLDSTLTLDELGALSVLNIAPIANGGTGAITAADARTNLDVFSQDEVNNAVSGITNVLQTQVVAVSGEVDFGTGNVIPFDQTIPQITEGAEVLDITVTPISATSQMHIEVVLHSITNLVGTMTSAIFEGTGVNAISSGPRSIASNDGIDSISMGCVFSNTDLSDKDFTVRLGHNAAAASISLNSDGTSSVVTSYIKVTEIQT